MHYFNKLVLLNSVEEISKEHIYKETAERLKNKNCCKKWSSNMSDRAYIEAYIKELSENSFKNKMKDIWTYFTNIKSTSSISFKSNRNICTLPSFLIIDDDKHSIITENIFESVRTSSCGNKLKRDDIISTKEQPLKNEGSEQIKKIEYLSGKAETRKRVQDLKKRYINVRKINEEAFSYYEDKFNDFLSVKTNPDFNDIDKETSSINDPLITEEKVKEEIIT